MVNVLDWNIRELEQMKLPQDAGVQVWKNPEEYYNFFREATVYLVDENSNVYMSTTDGFFHILEGRKK